MSNLTKHASFPICVFISGTGSNLESIIHNQDKYKVVLVVSNKKNAKGLDFARNHNIPIHIIDWNGADNNILELKDVINSFKCMLIVLAGFMKILPKEFIAAFDRQIINIHPSLLPKYPGLNTHKKVLENNDKIHGATVHFVNDKLDAGKIISQTTIEVTDNADVKSLAKQLLFREHSLLPCTINMFAQNQLHWQGDQLYFKNKILNEPLHIHE